MLATVLAFTVLPIGVYLVAYTPWIVNADKTYIHIVDCKNNSDCSLSIANRYRQFIEDQNRIWEFQKDSLRTPTRTRTCRGSGSTRPIRRPCFARRASLSSIRHRTT